MSAEAAYRITPKGKVLAWHRRVHPDMTFSESEVEVEDVLAAIIAAAVAEAREPLVALEWLAQELGTVIEIRSLRLDIIGTKPLPRKYAPDGIAYRLNGRNDREPPQLISREEAAVLLAEKEASE